MLNQIQIIGNMGADPVYRVTANNRAVAEISVASTEKWTDKETNEKHEETEWFKVIFWGRTADVARDYLKKGSKVYVSGKIKTRKWQDKDGNDRYTTELIGDRLIMLDGRKDEQQHDGGGFDAGDRLPSFDVPRRGDPL